MIIVRQFFKRWPGDGLRLQFTGPGGGGGGVFRSPSEISAPSKASNLGSSWLPHWTPMYGNLVTLEPHFQRQMRSSMSFFPEPLDHRRAPFFRSRARSIARRNKKTS